MLTTCDDSMEGLSNRALPCFGFASGGHRRSDISAADMRDLRKVGDEGYIYRLKYSKTHQAGVTANSTPNKPIFGQRRSLSGVAWSGGDPEGGNLLAILEGERWSHPPSPGRSRRS